MKFTNMSLDQFQLQFSTEEACAEYVQQCKWPAGFICPRCNHRHAYVTGTRRLPLFECSSCRHQTSLTAGTIMERSRTSLRKWLLALFLVSRTDRSINAVDLSQIIQVTYKTAWLILNKIRKVIHSTDQQTPLSGTVKINSAVYGRPFNPSVHKHPKEHLLLVGSSLNTQGDSTYLKIKLVLPDNPRERHISRTDTMTFTKLHVQSQSSQIEYVTGFFSPKRTRPLMAFASKASHWLNDTFHGIGAKHLQFYLDEFSYRLNLSLRQIPIFSHLTYLCFSTSSSQCVHGKRFAA